MKRLLILSIITFTQLQAQDLEWFNAEHRQGSENFRQLTFVESGNSSYMITYMEQLIQQGGGGGTGPQVSHFLYAYDTDGSQLWDFQIPSAPVKIINAGDGNFWILMSGQQSLTINGTTITSDFPWPEYRNYYFVKCNVNGEVIDSFYWESSLDVNWFIEDITLDLNGDFIFVGRMHPDQLSDLAITFANTTIPLPGDQSTIYLARAGVDGEQIAIATMETTRFQTGAIIRHLAQNTDNGDILVAGRMNGTFSIGDEILEHVSEHRDLFLLRFNEALVYQEGNVFPGSTYGSISYKLKFNPVNQRFYTTGSLGDELFLLNPQEPVAGHSEAASNAYIAEFEGINLIQGQYLIPLGPGSTVNVNIQDLAFDEAGDLRLVINVHDFSFAFGDSIIPVPSGVLNYDLAVMTLRMEDLSIESLSLTSSDGQTYTRATHFDPTASALYLAGTFNGTFTYDDYSENSFAGLNDAFIFRLTDEADIVSTLNALPASDFKLYPNPATSFFSIKTECIIQSLDIHNLSGQLVRQFSGTISNTFSTAELKPGIYFISIHTPEKTSTHKLIIH